jgi:hypothetical protein
MGGLGDSLLREFQTRGINVVASTRESDIPFIGFFMSRLLENVLPARVMHLQGETLANALRSTAEACLNSTSGFRNMSLHARQEELDSLVLYGNPKVCVRRVMEIRPRLARVRRRMSDAVRKIFIKGRNNRT